MRDVLDVDREKAKSKNRKPNVRPKKDKRVRVENADDIAGMFHWLYLEFYILGLESDDGDDEGREYDYMTDSGSETE